MRLVPLASRVERFNSSASFEPGDHAGALDFDAGRDFRVGKHREFREGGLEKAAEGEADLRRAENDWRPAGREQLLDALGETLDDMTRQLRLHHQRDLVGGLADALRDL